VSKDTPEGGKLPTPRVTREEAEALTEEIRAGLASWDRSMRGLLRHCFSGTVSPADLAESLQSQRGKWMAETADYPPDVATFLDELFFCCWLDELAAITSAVARLESQRPPMVRLARYLGTGQANATPRDHQRVA
jgi:hypothetical protein